MVAWFAVSECNLLEMVDQIPLSDTVARDRVFTFLILLRKLKASLQSFVDLGEQTQKEIESLLEIGGKPGFIGRVFGA